MSAEAAQRAELALTERIAASIYLIRGQKVMIDSALANLYEVETKALNQAVRRNSERFPEDFMFQLSKEEFENWRSQVVTSNPAAKMGLRYPPYAFTEHGIAMLSSVLRSPRAVAVNIAIVRTFIKLRQLLATHEEIGHRLDHLEWRESERDGKVKYVLDTIRRLIQEPEPEPKRRIGFAADSAAQ
jgi:hypothetical protein